MHTPDDHDWFELSATDAGLAADDLTGAQVARIGYSAALANTIDEGLLNVSTTGDARRQPGDFTRQAMALQRLVNRTIQAAMVADLMRGDDWETIAEALGNGWDAESAAYEFGEFDLKHLASDPKALWRRVRPSWSAADPAVAATELDQWASRHADPREAVRTDRPVTAGL
ncbi:hypothetical protein [Planomonospora sp. ID82291]|uniref:hypothetical protein n=1 Tax=Planomonospora sp. ID82291 TaxID=2738136 RepID=UPI0018C3C366|nr:hypothetical protein [Planomonospora sp. ID82291]MBG0818707.1 hypothetical protein [Planomonospora sp. ID82291]